MKISSDIKWNWNSPTPSTTSVPLLSARGRQLPVPNFKKGDQKKYKCQGGLKSTSHRYLPGGGLLCSLLKNAFQIKCGFEDSISNVDLGLFAKQPTNLQFCEILVLLNHSNNLDCSEISISVIVKHIQRIGVINVLELSRLSVCLGDFLSFSVPGGQKKIAGLCFANWISTQADTMPSISNSYIQVNLVYPIFNKKSILNS